jgi:RimJ/RimL family protein N-acetyltransferase
VWALDGSGAGLPDFLGTIGLRGPGPEGADLGYWVAPPFWGRGLATEAVRAVVAGAPFRGSLTASVFRDNPASARVLEAAGFRRIGEGEGFSVARGERVPSWLYRLER